MPLERGSEADFAIGNDRTRRFTPVPATLRVRVEARMLRHAAPADLSGLRNTVAGLKHVGQLTKQYKYRNDRAKCAPADVPTCRVCAPALG